MGITKLLLIGFTLLWSCSAPAPKKEPLPKPPDSVIVQEIQAINIKVEPELTQLEKNLIEAGLTKITDLDSTFILDLRYTTTNNFLQNDVYGDFNAAYLQPDVAERLVRSHTYLKEKYPGHQMVIFDAVRPRSVQRSMWKLLDSIPINERVQFVSNPEKGSLHNFGAAVDITLADTNGTLLDMGTDFDYFGELAFPTKEKELLASGELTQKQVDNRKMLREAMQYSDFFNIQTEWWHFNACYREEAASRYSIVE